MKKHQTEHFNGNKKKGTSYSDGVDVEPLTFGAKAGIAAGAALIILATGAYVKNHHDTRERVIDFPERHMAKEWILGKTPMARPGILIVKPGIHTRNTPRVYNYDMENFSDSTPDDDTVMVVRNPIIQLEEEPYSGPFDKDNVGDWLGFSNLQFGESIKGFKSMRTSEQVKALADTTEWVANEPDLIGDRLNMYSNPRFDGSTPYKTTLGDDGKLHLEGTDELVGSIQYMSEADAKLLTEFLIPMPTK